MQNLDISEKCFRINDMEYHVKLISKKYKDMPSFLAGLSMALSGVYDYSKKKGKVEYIVKGSSGVRKGRFEDIWRDECDTSFHDTIIELMEKPKIKIILKSYSLDNGSGDGAVVAKQKQGYKKWKRLPCEEIEEYSSIIRKRSANITIQELIDQGPKRYKEKIERFNAQ